MRKNSKLFCEARGSLCFNCGEKKKKKADSKKMFLTIRLFLFQILILRRVDIDPILLNLHLFSVNFHGERNLFQIGFSFVHRVNHGVIHGDFHISRFTCQPHQITGGSLLACPPKCLEPWLSRVPLNTHTSLGQWAPIKF